MSKITSEEFNKIVGAALRNRRNELGKPQTEIAEAVGVTFQQFQKYEKGINSMSLFRAAEVCKALGLNLSNLVGTEATTIETKLPLALVKNLNKLNEQQLGSVADLVRSLAKQ